MCGIVAAVAKRPISQILIDGLKRLEYRGYDSAGIAVLDNNQQLQRLRVAGKVRELEHALNQTPLHAHMGIAHTRWATHGAPTEENAHPFISHNQFALVHNGIIENHQQLRHKLSKAGYQFISDTDTETVVHLIHYHHSKVNDFLLAVRNTVKELVGAYALGIFSTEHPHRMIGVRQGAPLVVGKGMGENFLASDPLALLNTTQEFIYLEDYDIADITLNQIQIYDKEGKTIDREVHTLSIKQDAVERGEYRHYMKKEIMEQPQAVSNCLEGRLAKEHILPGIFGHQAEAILNKVKHIQLIACGTSYHAALVSRYWFESLAGIPCSVEVASEYRYRHIAQSQDSLFVTLSQSGETADTLAALRLAKNMGYLSTLAICNVPGSTMMREAQLSFLTHAGIEIGVASTKAFVTQLVSLFLLALTLRRHKINDEGKLEAQLVNELHRLPQILSEAIQKDSELLDWSLSFTNKQHALFIGRGALYPIAMEGALKMKEISYIHAEAYSYGELKHGPLALVDNNMPVIASVPHDDLVEKNLSNLQEVRARGGQLYLLSHKEHQSQLENFADTQAIYLPTIHPLLNPILYTIPLQLLAYHVAVLKGTDVDQPRNLAKSVTVE